MVIDFCYDDVASSPTLGYPNLAQPGLGPDDFDVTWPRVLPLRMLMYGMEFRVWSVDQAPTGAWYPVALGWHDFECDYFALMPELTRQRLRRGDIRALFYYHEGDNPFRIRERFDQCCDHNHLPRSCYRFISANSAADRVPGFVYFNDHEYFFTYLNRNQPATEATNHAREFEFTALNRTHKWWRASVMSDLHRHGVLDRSLWSYNTQQQIEEDPRDNPLQVFRNQRWQAVLDQFVAHGPYFCDHDNTDLHNDHREVNVDLYTRSYCHIVLETLLDVDQSGGAFLTEKTYKCIKFGQPFVIVGPAGSLAVLRRQGYRVFDHCIDNSYDTIESNTDRWLAARQAIQAIKQQDMHAWYLKCLDDVRHNQEVFAAKPHQDLARLLQRLTTDPDSV